MARNERLKNIKSAAEQRVEREKERWGISPSQRFAMSDVDSNLEVAKELLVKLYRAEKKNRGIEEKYREKQLEASSIQEISRLQKEKEKKLQHLHYRLWQELKGKAKKIPRMDHYTQVSLSAGPRETSFTPQIVNRIKDNVAEVKEMQDEG